MIGNNELNAASFDRNAASAAAAAACNLASRSAAPPV
jgi:hypothetical protein